MQRNLQLYQSIMTAQTMVASTATFLQTAQQEHFAPLTSSNFGRSTSPPNSSLCWPDVNVLSSHSELNHHFLPNRSQWKQPVGRPDEGISLEKQQPSHMFKWNSTSEQVVLFTLEGCCIELHKKVRQSVCPCVCWGNKWLAKAGRRAQKQKTFGDLFHDRLGKQPCYQEKPRVRC